MQCFIKQTGACQVLPEPWQTEDIIYYLMINHYVMILITLNDSCGLSAFKPNKAQLNMAYRTFKPYPDNDPTDICDHRFFQFTASTIGTGAINQSQNGGASS